MRWKPSSPSNEGSDGPGRVTDRRIAPLGVVPRHLQQWVLVGIALVMVGILALSGSPPKPRPSAAPSSAAVVIDPNEQRIEAYQRRIQEQAQRLAAEQAQLQLTKDAVVTTAGNAPTLPAVVEPDRPPTSAGTPSASREERGRFADNVAFSRPVTAPAGTALSEPASAPLAMLSAPPGRVAPVTVAQTAPSPPPTASLSAPTPVAEPATATPPVTPSRADQRSPSAVGDEPRYRLFEGTVIETVLTNRLDGTFAGLVNCLVSVPVYASDQQHLVIPAGSRVLGEARAVNTFGQSRLAVVFHRVILPNGTPVDLNGFHGLNQVGDLGLQDQVNRHYAQIFGVSLAIGAIGGLAQAQTAVGVDATGIDVYRQGAAANVSQSSARVLDRFLNLLPTVTIREGHRIKVYLSNDLALPAYRDALPLTGGRP
jgi:type IV secretory pathway VirB10-like protein